MHKLESTETLDVLFKQALSNKVFLALIMKKCIEEYKDEPLDKIIHEYIENHISVGTKEVHPRIAGGPTEINEDEKKTTYDINFYASLPNSKESIGVVINVEAQEKDHPGYSMMNRAHYYNARNISSQYNVFFTKSNFDGLRKVVSIWLILKPSSKKQDGINIYQMVERQVIGNVVEKEEDIKKNEIIMVYLSKESNDSFIQLMNDLRDRKIDFIKFRNDLKEEYDYQLDEKAEKEVTLMCNYGQYVRNEGKLEGREETILQNLRSLMMNMNWTLLEAMSALNISHEYLSKYEKMIQS